MKTDRLASLDVFRGITIAGMILVNNPGSWSFIYAPLRHAKWHGWTPTDLIFPFFLFIVGVSITLSFSKRISEDAVSSTITIKILKRTVLLFAVGYFLRVFPSFNFESMRIPGVLQRIALCYLLASLIFLKARPKGRMAIILFLLAGYWAVLKLVPVPGYGAGILEFEGNLCGFIDMKLLAGHLYKATFDPEGILSTFPAVATTLLGTLTGDWLLSKRSQLSKMAGLFVAGITFVILGLLLHPIFPINKQLWTSTYVIFSAGAALLLLGLCYGINDVLGQKKWAYPFLIFGTNAIAVYAGSTLMVKLIVLIHVPVQGEVMSLQSFIYNKFLVPWAGPLNGSLLYPIILLLIWLAILRPLYRKKIFIKI
ncbi:MAG: heparan-alpha-glucosaminide N-acetyltransferase domain-containing protein [Candidatus Aminicenantaceae bacterium]